MNKPAKKIAWAFVLVAAVILAYAIGEIAFDLLGFWSIVIWVVAYVEIENWLRS